MAIRLVTKEANDWAIKKTSLTWLRVNPSAQQSTQTQHSWIFGKVVGAIVTALATTIETYQTPRFLGTAAM
jgi:hypothetical protein